MNQILLVTGEPRSGTSLQMMMLSRLGVDVAGEQWPMHQGREESALTEEQRQRFERLKQLNPLGFFELPGVVGRGVCGDVPAALRGKAVKIVTSGAYPQQVGEHALGTCPTKYSQAILCLRSPRAISRSQQSLVSGADAADNEQWANPQFRPSARRYLQQTGGFACWLAEQPPEVLEKFVIVDYDNVVDDPAGQVDRIVQHLGLSASSEAKAAAAAVVDTNLRRSYLDQWPDPEAGELADRLYAALTAMDSSQLQAVRVDLLDYQHQQAMEAVRFVDTEHQTWRLVTCELSRDLASNRNGVREKLRATAGNFDFTRSQWYQLSETTYTVPRPADLGDLVRPHVLCTHPEHGGLMTIEQFRQLWLTVLGRQ